MDTFLSAFAEGILIGGLYALLALGVVVIYKSSKVFNIAHGEIMAFLAYFMVFLLSSQHLPVGVSFILVILTGLVLGLACERIFLRPLIGKPMLITFMVCLFLGLLIRSITLMWHGGVPQVLRLFPSGNLAIGSISLSHTLVWSFVIALAMFLIFVLYFRYTKTGLGMRCVAEDHQTSQSLGIDAKRVFALSWAIGGIMAAMGGVLLGSLTIVDTDTLPIWALIRALPVLLLGGLESIPGALAGGFIIGLTEILASTYIDPHVDGFRQLLPFILIVIILIIRPHGLFGLKRIERV